MKVLLPLLLTLLVPAALGQAPDPFIDCNADPRYRQFDFWLGQWQVHDAGGNFQGSNSVASVQRDCLITEHWKSAGGGGGQSLNYYDPQKQQWRQLWIDSGASIIDISGNLEQGSMVLVGTIYYLKTAVEHPFRGTWTPLEDGRVRQFFELQNDQGQWQSWFEGFYSRSGASDTGSSS